MEVEQEKSILERLLILKEEKERLEGEEQALWGAFFDLAEEKAGPDHTYRYLDEASGMVMARQIAKQETIDPKALEARLPHSQWLKVSQGTRVLDTTLLLAEMKRGHVLKDIVEVCTERKRIKRRYGPRKASKDDLAEIAAAERSAR